jgi:Bacterial conjugation TrbI-like protein
MQLIRILLPMLAFATYEGDLKRVNRMGDEADAILSHLGFEAQNSSGSTRGSEEAKSKDIFRVHGELANGGIKAGQLAFGKILNRLVVGGEESPVLLEVSDSRQGLLRGLRLLGHARQSSTAGRVSLDFDRLVLRSGKSAKVDAVGLDTSGALGLEAEIFSGKALMLAGGMVGSFLSGYAASQETTSTSAFGFSQSQPTGRNGLLQGVAQTAADQSKRMIDDATQEKPVLVISPGASVSILFREDSSL